MTTTNPLPIFDGHNDTLLSLYERERGEGASFFDHSTKGHIDLPRARTGGFGGGFFAVYVPPDPGLPKPEPLEFGYSQRTVMAMAAELFRIEAGSHGQVKVVRRADELADCLGDGVLAAILHFEGAEAIDPELDALEVFYRAGLRSLGLVWSRPNAFAHGVPFKFPHSPDTGPGLTDAGRALVFACNRLGILIDLSHLNEAGFWDVAGLSDAPLVATHSNVHAICAATRNLTERQLDAIRDSAGIVGLNFNCGFLHPEGNRGSDLDLAVMVDHLDALIERLGDDKVALGSDFDGATMPEGIRDVSLLPNLIDAMRARGYDDATIRKIAYGNWLRVMEQTWEA